MKARARLSELVGYHLGRLVRATLAFAVCGAFLLLFWRGWFPDLRLPGADLRRVGAAAVLTALLGFKISARVRTSERRRTPRREAISDAELGLLLLTTVFLLLAFWGGVTSPVYPLVYAVVSFLVTFHRLWVGLPLAAAAVGFEAVLSFGPSAPPEAAAVFPGHVVFIAVFALLNVVFLHAEVARQRRERRKRLEGEVAAMREEARDFRLIATALSSESRVRSRAEEQEKLSQGSIQTIHQQLYYNLALLRSALRLQTCALLWLDETGERLKVKELSSDSPHVAEGAIAAGGGVLGAILKELHPFVLESPRLSLLPYYGGPATVGAFVGVPVVEGRAPRGILVGDRAPDGTMDGKFDDRAVALMTSAAEQVVRVVQSERVFQAVERSKHEHERFYRASAELNRALTLDEVYAAAIAGARGVCEFEFAAIATYDARRGSHTIRSVVGESAEHLLGTTHKDSSSIASMAAKNKLALPAGGEWRERDVPVFSHPMRIKDYESLLVLPLLVKDEVIGTFTVAAQRAGAFPTDRREMLGVIANQVAISMQNARMYEIVEEQATTDGLTGLSNHRTFQERFSAMLGRAERRGFAVSLLLTDIDHFKKVNDTYGHPTGDEVLRRVAAILKASARKIDITARYGGEEFAIVLEGTDRAGAFQLAERIRQEVAQQSFASPQGAFQATLSIGVAGYPDDAREKAEIIARADQSLYAAKHGGRNRTVCFGDLERKPKLVPAAAAK
ncbi:MAG TPA: sensor domain-containing diguanylate cyclase [Polyangia bacterium]|jgi:diguanylate cyclase (GGDEF)-like protein|nr:sensor domain-containing diguanylate cyclase [Polyangia bacterium]